MKNTKGTKYNSELHSFGNLPSRAAHHVAPLSMFVLFVTFVDNCVSGITPAR